MSSKMKKFLTTAVIAVLIYVPLRYFVLEPNPSLLAVVDVLCNFAVIYWAGRWIYHNFDKEKSNEV